MQIQLTAIYQKLPDGYVAWVEEIPGAVTQGDTLDEARENLKDATLLMLEVRRDLTNEAIAGTEIIREPLLIDRD